MYAILPAGLMSTRCFIYLCPHNAVAAVVGLEWSGWLAAVEPGVLNYSLVANCKVLLNVL